MASDTKIPFERSFASHERAKYWSSRNQTTPDKVFKNTTTKYYFDCEVCNHEIYISPNKISTHNRWCCFCANQSLCVNHDCNICYNKSFASHPKSNCWSIKNNSTPRSTFLGSGYTAMFECHICKHEFSTTVHSVFTCNTWCPYCANTKLCGIASCQACFNKSFASSSKAMFWSSKNKLNPRDVFLNSDKKFKFNCTDCNHEFELPLEKISSQGRWCSYCSNTLLCNKECSICFSKSFASYVMSNTSWSAKNNKSPRDIFLCSNQNFWFDCHVCGHEYEKVLKSGCSCPFCCIPPKRLCRDNKCLLCFDKSFASHQRAVCWSAKNEMQPRDVFKVSGKSAIFECDVCSHEFLTQICTIANGGFCPICVNKTEKVVFNFLCTTPHQVINEMRFEWCKDIRPLPFDFLLDSVKVIIEVDGGQHFKFVSYFKNDVKQRQITDIYKMRKALEHGYTIIRILQEDIFYNRNDWKSNLLQHLHPHDTPQAIFICDNDEYDQHKHLLEHDTTETIASISHT